MDLTVDGWTWNQRIAAYVRILDNGDGTLEIAASLPVTGHMTYNPGHTPDIDAAEQVEQIIDALAGQLDRTIIPPDWEWLDAANLNPEQTGHRITHLIRSGRSFVYVAPNSRHQTRLYTADTRPNRPNG